MILYHASTIVVMILRIFVPLNGHDLTFLQENSPYYASLSPSGQRKFAKRVKDFMDDKDFVGQGIKVTRNMRLLISSSAVQITFGLRHTILLHFRYIHVFPDSYRSRSGAMHKGEVNPGARSITLSWKHFEEGIADRKDGVDLGLHEMAHALWLEDGIPNYESGFLSTDAKQKWSAVAQEFIGDSDRCKLSIFRNYGCSNTREFFAVAVEHFFERPVEFKEHEPELYQSLIELLQQDPLTT